MITMNPVIEVSLITIKYALVIIIIPNRSGHLIRYGDSKTQKYICLSGWGLGTGVHGDFKCGL